MTIKLTVSPQIKARLQRNQSHSGYTEMLTCYVQPDVAAKVNQLAKLNQRSLSSVLAEMLTFALDRLSDGDAELEESASGPLSYNDLPKEQQRSSKPKVTLRMTVAPKREPTFADIAEESLKRIVPEFDYDKHVNEAHRRNVNALNGYGLIRE